MPFLGKDWRSTGEQWVRTTDGWERLHTWRLRLMENLNENFVERLVRLTSLGKEGYIQVESFSQPHIFIIKTSRERKMQTGLSDCFNKLDMIGAAKDRRRFNYITKLLEIIVREKLCDISGTSQKIVFNLMEAILSQVKRTETNHSVMQKLLDLSRQALKDGIFYHVGCRSLWHKHVEAIDKMQNTLNTLEIKARPEDGQLMISDLPDECVRSILVRMADGRDIANTGMTDCRHLTLAEDKVLWRDLCLFHFDNQQIFSVLRKGETDVTEVGWKKLYTRLMKRYGARDVFAEMLYMCRHCNAIYWQHHGHPCLCPDLPAKAIPVPPVMCIQLFNA